MTIVQFKRPTTHQSCSNWYSGALTALYITITMHTMTRTSTVHSVMHDILAGAKTVRCTMITVRCTMITVRCTMVAVRYVSYAVHFRLRRCTLQKVKCTSPVRNINAVHATCILCSRICNSCISYCIIRYSNCWILLPTPYVQIDYLFILLHKLCSL